MKRNRIIENVFMHKGYECVVLFTNMGHRCGYVGISANNKFYEKKDKEDILSSHGGITFAGRLELDDERVSESLWWLGFDCAHAGDKPDYEKAIEYFGSDNHIMRSLQQRMIIDKRFPRWRTMRTQEYVERCCKELVEELIRYED